MASNQTSALQSPSQIRRFPPLPISDSGKVRLGGQGPIFRIAATADSGKVRVGGQGPIFRSTRIALTVVRPISA